MISFIEFILDIGELFLSWRLYVALALTGVVIWVVNSLVSDEMARWAICIPLGILGFAISFYWQVRAD